MVNKDVYKGFKSIALITKQTYTHKQTHTKSQTDTNPPRYAIATRVVLN